MVTLVQQRRSGYPTADWECEQLSDHGACTDWWRGDGRQSLYAVCWAEPLQELCGQQWTGEGRQYPKPGGDGTRDLQGQWDQYQLLGNDGVTQQPVGQPLLAALV